MALVPISQRWTRQPPGGLDVAHPLLRDLLQGVIAGATRNATDTYRYTSVTAPTGRTVIGEALEYGGSSARAAAPTVADASPWTVLSYGVRRSSAGFSSVSTVAEAPGSATVDRSLGINAAGTVQAAIYDDRNRIVTTTAAVGVDVPCLVAAVATGSAIRAYGAGELASLSASNAGFAAYSTPELVLGYGQMTSSTQGSYWSAAYTLQLRRALSLDELVEWERRPWQIFAPRRILIPIGAASGSTVTTVSSLSAAIQAARSATASLGGAVSAPASAQASIAAAVASAGSAQTGLTAAVSAATSRVAQIQAAVQAAGQRTTSLDAALQLARSATTALGMAVQAQASATATISAQVQANGQASASLDAYVQAGNTASVALAAAVLRQALGATSAVDAAISVPSLLSTSMNGALQVARTAAAVIDAALVAAQSASIGVSAQVQAGTSVSLGLDAAIRAARTSTASLQAALSVSLSTNLALGTAVLVQATLGALLSGALSERRTALASLSAYVDDPATYTGSLDIVALQSIVTQLVSRTSQPRQSVAGDSPIGE